MDVFGLGSYGTTFLFGALLILTIYLFGRRNFSFFKDRGLPGPEPISHVGNFMELSRIGFCCVYRYWAKKYGDIFGIFHGVNPVLVISDPEMVQDILVKKYSYFPNRTHFMGDEIANLSLPNVEDDHWKYLRSILSPSFTSHQMRRMNELVQRCANTLVGNIGKLADSGEATSIKTYISAYTIDVISATGFGIIVDSQSNPNDPLVEKAKGIFEFNLFNPFIFLTFMLPWTTKYVEKFGLTSAMIGKQKYFRKFCQALIDKRKATINKENTPKNLLNLMLKAQLVGHEELLPEEEKELELENITDWRTKRGITDKEILAQCTAFFLTGYETTASTLTFFTYLMSVNPEAQQKLYEEIVNVLGQELPTYDNIQQLPYLNMCMEETLRLYPIGTVLDRIASKACTIKEINIPAGLTVNIAVDVLHFNPKYWSQPEKFIPERFNEEGKSKQVPFTYLPFGGGPRMCIGMRLAKLEFKIAAVEVIRKFKILSTEKTEIPLELDKTFLLAAKNGVWVKFERR